MFAVTLDEARVTCKACQHIIINGRRGAWWERQANVLVDLALQGKASR